MNLPQSLTRNAVIATFQKISPVAWEKLFEREHHNGLAGIRVSGSYPGKIYYSTEALIQWLISNNRYTVDDIVGIGQPRPTVIIRQHVMAG